MNGNMNLGKRVSTLEKDGGADIKKEISDLQDAVTAVQGAITTAQEEISNLENKVNSGHVYSTEEKIVGKWTDGKPLYELTFDGNELSIPNVDHLHFVQSMAHSTTYDNYDPIPMSNYECRWTFSKTNSKITLNDNTGFHDTYNTTIQYTKTTDNQTQ